METTGLHSQEVYQTPGKINARDSYSDMSIIKLLKHNDKERILKAARYRRRSHTRDLQQYHHLVSRQKPWKPGGSEKTHCKHLKTKTICQGPYTHQFCLSHKKEELRHFTVNKNWTDFWQSYSMRGTKESPSEWNKRLLDSNSNREINSIDQGNYTGKYKCFSSV